MTRTLRAAPAPADITSVRLDSDVDVGIVVGLAASGEPAAVPFFSASRATRTAILGDRMLPRLLAMRALGAGARLQIEAAQPASWLRLRGACLLPHRMTIGGPGQAAPSGGTRAAPSMLITDAGDQAADADAWPVTAWPVTACLAAAGPWQAFVAVSSARAVPVGTLRGLDTVILHRSSPACRAAVVAALELPDSMARSLQGIPDDVVAIASPGLVRLVSLAPHPAERALLARSEQREAQ